MLEATTQWHPRPPSHTPPTGSPAPVCADVTGPPPFSSTSGAIEDRKGLSLAPLSSGRDKSVGLVVEECLKDGIGEAALEDADRLASAVPSVLPAVDQDLCRWMPSGLDERDPVQGSVQLTVSGAAQP